MGYNGVHLITIRVQSLVIQQEKKVLELLHNVALLHKHV